MAAIVEIPTDYTTIQEGINNTDTGDTVLVLPGAYYENLTFNGNNITLMGEFGLSGDTASIAETILNGNATETVILIENPLDTAVAILGLTVTNGQGYPYGTYATAGGITCKSGASVTINHVVVSNNQGTYGGGILIKNARGTIENCMFSENIGVYGGGILIFDSNVSITSSGIHNNVASSTGGGLYVFQSEIVIDSTTIESNLSENTGGGIHVSASTGSIQASSIIGNTTQTNGGGVFSYSSDMDIADCNIDSNWATYNGGGCYLIFSSMFQLQASRLQGNHAQENGGALYCGSSSHIMLGGSRIIYNTAGIQTGGLYFTQNSLPVFDSSNRCSIYLNVGMGTGNEISIDTLSSLTMPLDTFTVFIPTDYHCFPFNRFTIDMNASILGQVSADLFVNPDGSNDNSGLSVDMPLKTIHYALSIIIPDSTNPHTVHLSDGVYSPATTGEYFPITLPDYISLNGESRDSTILDAAGVDRVVTLNRNYHVSLSNMTLTGGEAQYGGGISIHMSSPVLSNLRVVNNHGGSGGGIHINESSAHVNNVLITNNNGNNGAGIFIHSQSDPIVENVRIAGNTAVEYGGGVYCSNSNPVFIQSSVHNNLAATGGGLYFTLYSDPVFDTSEKSNIYLNVSGPLGRDLYADLSPSITVDVDTFTVLSPTEFQAHPRSDFSFSILNGKVEQVSQDLYVATTGSDMNVGTDPDYPLQTLSFALSRISGSHTDPITLHLEAGAYSPSQSGEVYPLYWLNNVNMSGESPASTILDAEGSSNIIIMDQVEQATFENISIQNGFASQGGGVQAIVSNPVFQNVHFVDNNAENHGGGISANFSNPTFTDVIFRNNAATFGGAAYLLSANSVILRSIFYNNAGLTQNGRGGALYLQNSDVTISKATLTNNFAQANGGSMYFYASSAWVTNSIFWNNSPNEIEFSSSFTSNTFVSAYNDIRHGTEGVVINNNGTLFWEAGNISLNPLWTNPGGGDFSLGDDSPCINSGIGFYDFYGNILVDFDSTEYVGIAPDMGAFESDFLDNHNDGFLPTQFGLYQNYPNPFNPLTTISYLLPVKTHVKLSIFNLLGEEIMVLVDREEPPGQKKALLDGSRLASGVYFYTLSTGAYQATKKLILLK